MSAERRDVLHDTAMGVAGVFRPLRKRKEEREKLDVEQTWGTATVQWRSPDQLDISDQSVLFAVLEVAGGYLAEAPNEALVTAEGDHWSLLGHDQHVFRASTVQVTTTFGRLARLCSLKDGGTANRRVQESLRRLTETTVWVRVVDKDGDVHEGSSRLLGWQLGDRHRVSLIVNWRLGEALRGTRYGRISLKDRYSLSTDVARALHALLSCRIDQGKAMACGLDKLQVHIWGNVATDSNLRQRRSRMREALQSIGQLPGWRVEFGLPHVRITRVPGRPAQNAPAFQSRGGVSVTTRVRRDATPSYPSHLESQKPSNGAGSDYVDLTALISTRD